MTMASCSSTFLEYIKKGTSTVLLRAGHKYCVKTKNKNGTIIWECAHRKKSKCTGSITLKDNQIVKEKQHNVCEPDFAGNEVLMRLDNLKKNISDPETPAIPTAYNTEDESCEPKPKKPRNNKFTIVKKCCIDLVKKHGRSVTLFDDLAFRELMDLIPMTQSEKQILSSQYIQSLLDDDQLADQTETETMDRTNDDIADDDDDNSLQAIKGEVEPIPCTCGKDTDESMSRHTVECPASSQQTYWNFFEVSLDSAICQICNKTLTWTNISTLKEHLQHRHPSVDFVDDDDEFQKGPPSEDGSTNDFSVEEVVYLEEILSESEQTASAAKRRKKRAKAALNITGPITRKNIATRLQRFKSLEIFGQYVASLMKLIPKDKCIKLQIQMVERLLQEQAAAG